MNDHMPVNFKRINGLLDFVRRQLAAIKDLETTETSQESAERLSNHQIWVRFWEVAIILGIEMGWSPQDTARLKCYDVYAIRGWLKRALEHGSNQLKDATLPSWLFDESEDRSDKPDPHIFDEIYLAAEDAPGAFKQYFENLLRIGQFEGLDYGDFLEAIPDSRITPEICKSREREMDAEHRKAQREEVEELWGFVPGRECYPSYPKKTAIERLFDPDENDEQERFGSPDVLNAPTAPYSSKEPKRRPPPWFIAYSKKFKKSVLSIDRKIQGKIMEALLKLSDDPVTAKGNTIKPLTGDLKDYWRMRIGDFRIIYYPDISTGNITLVDFSSRSSIYD